MENPPIADEALVERVRQGDDPQAFEELVRRHQGKVLRLAASVLGPEFGPEAEDLTQEIFLEVFAKLHTFRGRSRFATWLYRVALRRAIDRKRRVRFHRPHLGEEALPRAEPTLGHDPATRAIDAQRHQALRQAVAKLAEPYRTVIYLHYWWQRSVAEMAELLDVPEGTLKARLHRARKLLAEKEV